MKKPEVRRLAIEGLMIVFSVLFALFISQLADNRKVRNQKELAIDYIYRELKDNKETLERWVIKHQKARERISRMVRNPMDSTRLSIFAKGQPNYSPITEGESLIDALLGDTAWESAKATQIVSQFDFAVVQDLTRIYGLQKVIMEGSVNKFTDVYFDRESQDPAHLQTTLVQLELVMNELVGQEYTLIYMLKTALEKQQQVNSQ